MKRQATTQAFASARVIGPYGMQPYGLVKAAAPSQATSVDNFTLLPGFKAELIYSVPKNVQGSWVSMAHDPKGRLYVSDQAGPLYRVTPGNEGTPTKIEQVDLEIGHAQGLLWAFDSLYVVVNEKNAARPSGLYRLRDTDGDDKLDQITKLKDFKDRQKEGPGWGEHGPHGIVLGPDNKLYMVAGNFTNLPDGVAPTSPAQHWAEDLLLKRMPDGRGHDPTIYAPASWVCRTDENGKTWENIAMGMRNAYDIAFSPEGELFTYDSDMEWDIGAPWYRPTRICHLVSGAEFGWRNGSAKWPTYYADSVPPVVDIGLGSPTGVTFGTGAKFPAKYQRAFFGNDWAYGKIYAVHMKPEGASYSAEFEPFVVGKPFDVTDIVINTDGAMYVTIGGRGTQSGLYRISYVGDESTEPAAPVEDVKSPRRSISPGRN
jgi:glucose/arabinose dehydrogenase